MKNHLTPSYYSNLVPPIVCTNQRYTLRNSEDVQNISTRTETHYQSFLPSVIRAFNALPLVVRNAPSLASFKMLLNRDQMKVPGYFL